MVKLVYVVIESIGKGQKENYEKNGLDSFVEVKIKYEYGKESTEKYTCRFIRKYILLVRGSDGNL